MLREILGQDGQSVPAPSGIVTAGLNHFAYALNGMQELFDNYDRLKALGHLPYWCIDHGPSTAMYYHDPDGNSVEFQVDNFPTSEECTAYLRSPSFAQNPIGIEYDPEVKRKELRTGKRT
jgi:catechol-2,3-dioxygenase